MAKVKIPNPKGGGGGTFQTQARVQKEAGKALKAISGGPLQVPSNERLREAKVSSASPHDLFDWFYPSQDDY